MPKITAGAFGQREQKTAIVPDGKYIVEIKDWKEGVRPCYYQSISKDKKVVVETVYLFSFELLAKESGTVAFDSKGEDITGMILTRQVPPERLGFRANGVPSIARDLVARALGYDPREDDMDFEWEELLGKKVIAVLEVRTGRSGVRYSSIEGFLPYNPE